MNMLIYDNNGNLVIRKNNGLQYQFDNTEPPNLGFEYDVLIYDDIEVKILKWDDSKDIDGQEKIELNSEECDAIETYIANSEPPSDVNLNTQYINNLNVVCNQYIQNQHEDVGFATFQEVIYAGRSGSNHPFRSDARGIMEYADVVWTTYLSVVEEIKITKEDVLKPYEEYMAAIPGPMRQLYK